MHEVTHLKGPGIISCRHWGEMTEADVREARDKVQSLIDQTGVSDVLVDMCAATPAMDTVEIFEFASDFKLTMRVAMLIEENHPMHDDLEFLETVAINRGNDFSLHTCRDDALRWLQPSNSMTGDTIAAS